MKVLPKSEKATITVYLSLILLLILSLIFTIIEGARISTVNVFAERSLSTATDSVLADFYGPLWEEYHLFGYDAGEGRAEEKADRLEEALSEYMSYTLNPGKELTGDQAEGTLNLLGISLASTEIGEQTRLMDYKGELFRNEAVEYMKYDTAADAIKILLDKLSLLEKPKKVSVLYEEKLEAEEKLAEVDRSALRLMELFDGLCTSKKGIRLNQKGKLQLNEYYIKMLYTGEITPQKIGINSDAVFQRWKENYSSPGEAIRVTRQQLQELEALTSQQKEIDRQLQNAEEELSSAKGKLASMGKGSSLSKEDKKQIKDIRQQITECRGAENSLQTERTALLERKQKLTRAVEADCQKQSREMEEILPLIQEAISIIDKISDSTSAATPLIEKFEQGITKEKGELGTEILKELSESLIQMKRYTEETDDHIGYPAMQEFLTKNRALLLNVRALVNRCLSDLKNEKYSSCRELQEAIMIHLSNYRVTELALDYSSLVLKQEKIEDPVEAVQDAMNSGLTTLVLDPEVISDKELTGEGLPSIEGELLIQDTDFGSAITDFVEDFRIGGNTSGIQNIMNCFTDTDTLFATLNKGLNQASEYLLFQEYLKEHFETFAAGEENITNRKPSALAYEQEYLLYGKRKDRDNLSSLVGRLIFLRMSANFVTLLGDRVRVQEALAAATALVGFTGFPALISITKAVLLLIWSFAEALIDVCALIQGKEVPVLKKAIVLRFPEIFLLNRDYLQTRVPMLEQSKLSLSYREYLYLFLLLKDKEELTYHAMDLIQENINLRYEDEFSFVDCLYGFQAKAEFTTATKFIAVPIIKNYLNHTITGYRFQFHTEACY